MGVILTNLEPGAHVQQGVMLGYRVRLHWTNAPSGAWDTAPTEVSRATWRALLHDCATSATDAATAVAALWPAWWSRLSSSQRAVVADGMYAYAVVETA